MKFKFIDDARGAWKLLSMHVAAIWTAIFAFVVADPNLFLTAYNTLPQELRDFLPAWVRWLVVASAMFGTIYLARVVKQPVTKAGAINEEVKKLEAEGVPSEESKRALAAAIVEEKERACTIPPQGWICTRGKGHEGPCAAVPMSKDATESHL